MSNELNGRDVANAVTGEYREMTTAAMVLGIFQGIILNLAFVYAALKLGFSIGGSTVAAIMGYALLRGVMGKGTMIENNINQTVASGVNNASAGVGNRLDAGLHFISAATGAIVQNVVEHVDRMHSHH